ncbi:MAG: iron ABC transporter permease [Coriobacteriales bacterium]|nr:iron ABC transporter permease [Coriobacteriales bacterium]
MLGITLISAILLSVAGMLYQNVFRNPIAGPGMLGVSSGVSLGMMLLVVLQGASVYGLIVEHYLACYGFGAALLLFVILAGRRLSGKGKSFDIVTILLIGSIFSQLIGFIVSYVTLFVMEPDHYEIFFTLSQMLVVDVSVFSWIALGVAFIASIIPVWLLRFQFNALAFDVAEVKLLGINYTALRTVALVCGAIMILAAQVHVGMVGMISLIVPFFARSWFGCEFRKQLIGNVCISTILLIICRDIADLIPFVGDGLALGSVVSVVALPLFLIIVIKQLRGWE